jgi:hypothetical protein
MARPSKIIKRTQIIRVRLTPGEYILMKEYASRTKLSLAVYVRSKSLNHTVKNRLSSEEVELLRVLIGLANNLNQYLKLMHAFKRSDTNTQIQNLITEIGNVIQKLK